jgi:hypothetical protein
MRATQSNGFDALALNDACAWLRFAPHLLTHLLAQRGMKPFEDAILPP